METKIVPWNTAAGWKPYERIRYVNRDGIRWPVEIGHREDDPYTKWCVQFGGNGHYFTTYDECLAYCKKRGWLSGKLPDRRYL